MLSFNCIIEIQKCLLFYLFLPQSGRGCFLQLIGRKRRQTSDFPTRCSDHSWGINPFLQRVCARPKIFQPILNCSQSSLDFFKARVMVTSYICNYVTLQVKGQSPPPQSVISPKCNELSHCPLSRFSGNVPSRRIQRVLPVTLATVTAANCHITSLAEAALSYRRKNLVRLPIYTLLLNT